jgi:hypothetical protein
MSNERGIKSLTRKRKLLHGQGVCQLAVIWWITNRTKTDKLMQSHCDNNAMDESSLSKCPSLSLMIFMIMIAFSSTTTNKRNLMKTHRYHGISFIRRMCVCVYLLGARVLLKNGEKCLFTFG